MHHFAIRFLGSLEFSMNIILLFVDYNTCFYSCIGQYDGPRCAAALAFLHLLMVCQNTYKLTMGICKALPYY
jgi:hypothetical protein